MYDITKGLASSMLVYMCYDSTDTASLGKAQTPHQQESRCTLPLGSDILCLGFDLFLSRGEKTEMGKKFVCGEEGEPNHK